MHPPPQGALKEVAEAKRLSTYKSRTCCAAHPREKKEQLSRECAKEVYLVQKAIAQDYRADPAMAEACKEDVETYCKDVKEGGGRKAACLVSCE
jgi:hypothetical protein